LAVAPLTTRDEAIYYSTIAFLPTPPAFDAVLGGRNRSIAMTFVVKRYVYLFRQNTRM